MAEEITKNDAADVSEDPVFIEDDDDPKQDDEGKKDDKPDKGKSAEKEGVKSDEDKDVEKKDDEKEAAPFSAKDIKLPKGMEYDEATGGKFEKVVSKYGLSKEAAGDLAKLYFELIGETQGKMDASIKAAQKASAEAISKAIADEEKAWLEAAKADDEIGGQNWKRTKSNIDRALRELNGRAFAKFMTNEGYNNHPEVLRFLNRVGAALAEDTFGGGRSSVSRKSDAEVFYGKD